MIQILFADNVILREDMEQLGNEAILRELPENSSILVTGATGLIGSQLVKSLACHSLAAEKPLRIFAMVRNESKAHRMFGSLVSENRISLLSGDIVDPLDLQEDIDYIFHCASPTGSAFFVQKPVETAFAALDGTRNVLEYAKAHRVKKVVFLSSLEVYGTTDPTLALIDESCCGHIDPMQVRSSYSEGKRMAECLCVSYWKEYGVPVSVARLTQILGAGVPYDEGKVFAEFARCAIEGKNIVLHTAGNTVRNYCYTADTVSALFHILLKGQPGEAYNVANMDTAISIAGMAELVCSLSQPQEIRVEFDIPEDLSQYGYNPERIIRLDSRKLQALGWSPRFGLREMYSRMISSMVAELNAHK